MWNCWVSFGGKLALKGFLCFTYVVAEGREEE
jgi:hypothetical protein